MNKYDNNTAVKKSKQYSYICIREPHDNGNQKYCI